MAFFGRERPTVGELRFHFACDLLRVALVGSNPNSFTIAGFTRRYFRLLHAQTRDTAMLEYRIQFHRLPLHLDKRCSRSFSAACAR